MPDQPLETWEAFSKDLEPRYDIHLRDEGIRNSLHETMGFSTGHNQAAIASLNQATIAREDIASDKPYHPTSVVHFTNEAQAHENMCLIGQVAGTLPVCHRLGLLYQFYPDARDNNWTP